MSSPVPPPTLSPRKLDFLAALLSFLLPGLGQVYQGRVGKGLLFFICLYGLFFYGLSLGKMKNVWLPDAEKMPEVEAPVLGKLNGVPKALYYRPQFLGQFWIGVASWPAILQYAATEQVVDPDGKSKPTKLLGHYMQTPNEAELNNLQRSDDKRWDLGWVYTVIAGVLNILVIYDAFAGPVIRDEETKDKSDSGNAKTPPPGGPA